LDAWWTSDFRLPSVLFSTIRLTIFRLTANSYSLVVGNFFLRYYLDLIVSFQKNIIIAESCKYSRMGLLSFLGLGNKITEAIQRGAVIIDVRPAYAFDQHGRVPGSINIPVDRIPINVERIRSLNKPVVICCEYGSDCANAVRILKASGIKEVYHGGSWQTVFRKVK
jgi:rhodanese-related sulfurtransferase